MTNHPEIAVVIPVRDRPERLVRCVESVLAQQGVHLEVVVADDGSTVSIADALTQVSDDRLKLVRIDATGAAAARNAAVAASRAAAITFIDSDDWALAGWLQALNGALTDDVELAFCGARWVDGDDTSVRLPADLGPVHNHRVGLFLAGTYAMTRELYDEVGGFSESLPSGNHTDLALKLGRRGALKPVKTKVVSEPLVHIERGGSDSIRKDPDRVLRGTLGLLSLYRTELADHRAVRSNYLAVAAVAARDLGRWPLFVRLGVRSVTADPRRMVRAVRDRAARR